MRSPRSAVLRRGAASVGVLVLVGAAGVLPAAGPATAATPAGQFWVARLGLHKVWKITEGQGVTVAVVDSGVPATPSLGSRLLKGTDIVSGGGTGRSDPGGTAGGGGGLYSHGQQMAELIGGNGHDGNTGIAPKVKILPVKVQARTNQIFSPSAGAQGIRWAVGHGASVVNVSIGGAGACDAASASAIKYAYQHDVIVVVASGNAGVQPVEDPANCPGAIAVSGIENNGSPWSGSNYGTDVDLTNFSVGIPVLTLGGVTASADGTSAATAFTSGEIALLRSRFPKDSARQIVTRLIYGINTLSSVPTGKRVNDHVGYGIPVPLGALKAKLPAGYDVNPIYDAFAKTLGPGPGNPSSSPSGGSQGSSTPPGGAAPSSSSSGSSGTGVGPIVIIAIVVVLIAGGISIAVVTSRAKRRRPPPGYGPPGGYGPPPPGYGPRG